MMPLFPPYCTAPAVIMSTAAGATGNGTPTGTSAPVVVTQQVGPPVQESLPRTAGTPLSDFVMQLEDYTPTVS